MIRSVELKKKSWWKKELRVVDESIWKDTEVDRECVS